MSAQVIRAATGTLHELRFLFSSTSAGSAGVREFISNTYPKIKAANPTLPVLVRPGGEATPARVFARFENGAEIQMSIDGASPAAIHSSMAELFSKAKLTFPKA
ncbi:hypothetical protein H696_00278 [Fonticula alba]|uniref:Ribosomal protein/NADH dehydrogenase domain-containing protein n=1 Tax=Fonticula alba TaxID=691883 RepID=A0A058ZEA2_FONAL|nr:hypothetical protein H696_00278 [Fonticula alba]KCV72699.1 hypothetical protein H696_00278 [Fonticula alba]|eukprot:XP_009492400.1 hypothetical protein H696_00278 [Fonticula alba]